ALSCRRPPASRADGGLPECLATDQPSESTDAGPFVTATPPASAGASVDAGRAAAADRLALLGGEHPQGRSRRAAAAPRCLARRSAGRARPARGARRVPLRPDEVADERTHLLLVDHHDALLAVRAAA